MILKDGSIRTFEVSIEQFNQLRYNVAKVILFLLNASKFEHFLLSFQALSEIQTLQRHPIVKIVSEFMKREVDDYPK